MAKADRQGLGILQQAYAGFHSHLPAPLCIQKHPFCLLAEYKSCVACATSHRPSSSLSSRNSSKGRLPSRELESCLGVGTLQPARNRTTAARRSWAIRKSSWESQLAVRYWGPDVECGSWAKKRSQSAASSNVITPSRISSTRSTLEPSFRLLLISCSSVPCQAAPGTNEPKVSVFSSHTLPCKPIQCLELGLTNADH